MELTKLEHSGLIIKNGEKRLVFDPVEFKETIPALEKVTAVVITHKHGDHLQMEVLEKILNNNPEAKIFTTSDTAPLIDGAIIVRAGDIQELDGFELKFFGRDHAAIIPGQIPCENIGVVVNDRIVNPGDSFDLPDTQANVLLVPVAAPWLKTHESMDFTEKARPKTVIPIHDALFSELGKAINGNWMKKACENIGAEYKELKSGERLSI